MRFRLNLTHRNCHNSLIFLGRVIDLAGSPPEWGAVKEQVAADNKEQASLDQVGGGAAKEHAAVSQEQAALGEEQCSQEQAPAATTNNNRIVISNIQQLYYCTVQSRLSI